MRAARDAKAGVRLSDLERNRSQCALRLVPGNLERADPIIALMSALHVSATSRHGITLDGLLIEGVACGHPVFERASFEIEVERFAVFAEGEHALRNRGKKGSGRK